MSLRFWISAHALACIVLLVDLSTASAYVPNRRWTNTASGSTGSTGDPITLTWGLVADDTHLSGEGDSNLIEFLDQNFGAGPGGTDLTQRPWFQYFDDSFNRWSELSGVTYVYEPNDDGVSQGTFWAGKLGQRADIRIGGADVDGPSGTLAYNYYPNNGDMVIDTSDAAFYTNNTFDYRPLRNVIMHEAGHGLGIDHVVSSTHKFLLEPYISSTFDGPQFDDIRGMQAYYGDFFEKDHGGQGNDSVDFATSLGSIATGSTLSIGADATDAIVNSTDTDFVSIDNNTDIDFFSIAVDGPSLLDIVLTPIGPTYDQGPQGGIETTIITSELSDLALAVFDSDKSTLLGTSDITGYGLAESLSALNLPDAGDYYVRVTGADSAIQFYQLDISVESSIVYEEADFDQDGDVDTDDYYAWQLSFGFASGGDADGDGDTDGIDFLSWQRQFSGGFSPFSAAIAVPEPQALCLLLLGGVVLLMRRV